MSTQTVGSRPGVLTRVETPTRELAVGGSPVATASDRPISPGLELGHEAVVVLAMVVALACVVWVALGVV